MDVNKSALAAADTKYAEQEGWYVEPSVKVLPTLGILPVTANGIIPLPTV